MTDKKEQLVKEITQCLIIKDDEKSYWLNNVDSLPETIIDILISEIGARNRIVEGYINVALRNDKDGSYLNEAKTILSKTKKMVLDARENETKVDEEAILDDLNFI